MTPQEKVDIIMHEYETLRTEIMNRCKNRQTMLAFLGAIAAFVLTRPDILPESKIWIAVGGFIFVFFFWCFDGFLIGCCSSRVHEIERRVNELAGEKLLVWETQNMFAKKWRVVLRKMRLIQPAKNPSVIEPETAAASHESK